MSKYFYSPVIVILAALVLAACNGESTDRDDGRLKVVATTGMIADAVAEIAGEHAEVVGLMGPGVDPHLYKTTQGDLTHLTEADIIFYNGLHLEGKMSETLEELGRTKNVVPVSDGVDAGRLLKPAEFEGNYDPHIWFDVDLWSGILPLIAGKLAEIDPDNAESYKARAAAYGTRLDSLNAWVREQIMSIPKEQRVLVTAHDAFGYFGQAYDIEVRGLQGISTVAEFGLADVRSLIDLLIERKIKAVFIESSIPRRSIEAVVQGARSSGHEVKIGGELYSDAMGEKGGPAGTYIGMVSSNVNTIVEALQ